MHHVMVQSPAPTPPQVTITHLDVVPGSERQLAMPGTLQLPAPHVWRPFTRGQQRDLARHVAELRRLYDWPGMPYHDADAPEDQRFNRWQMHNVPLLRQLHHSPRLISRASLLAGEPLKPSYCFLSMYGRDGVCPQHTDRPACHMTVDYLVGDDCPTHWPLIVDGHKVLLQPGEAVLYSGTRQHHHRAPIADAGGTRADLVFFHFVPVAYAGALD